MEAFVVLVTASAAVARFFGGRRPVAPPDSAPAAPPPPALVAAAPPSPGTLSFDGLVRHYVVAGVVRPRPEDSLPFDRPLAPDAPEPNQIPIGDVIARLPVFPVSGGAPGG